MTVDIMDAVPYQVHNINGSVSYKTTDEMAQWLNRVGRKVLSASQRRLDSAVTLVFGKGTDGTCFRVACCQI